MSELVPASRRVVEGTCVEVGCWREPSRPAMVLALVPVAALLLLMLVGLVVGVAFR